MKQKLVIRIIAFAACLTVVADAAPQKTKLPEFYRKWLDEEVVYIITSLEKDVFLKLQSDRERDLFLDAFWKHRDPNPGAKENAFKVEHYKRIAHANKYYGRSAPMPGWKADRGRMYILLGEPNDIQRFTKQGIYPCEIWFYQDKAPVGLPAGFNLLFFQEGGLGDFKIYSPAKDGPQALLQGYFGDPVDYMAAYEQLRELENTIADVSMSLIPGESNSGLGRPSLASDMLVSKVENVARSQVEERYAQKFLQYKDMVEVEYSTNFLDSDAMVKVLKDPGVGYFVHYAVEPKRLSVNSADNKYFTALKINGTVTAPDGKMIFQFDRTANISLDATQMRDANQKPFDYHDMFPLIPGTYKISILVKNEASKEFSSLEQTLVIPGETPALQMTSPILGYKTARVDAAKRRLKPFQLGAVQVYCQPSRVFTKKDTLSVAFQVNGLSPAQKSSGLIKYTLSRPGQPAIEKVRTVAEYPELPNIVEEFPLADITPAHYVLKVSVLSGDRELVAGTEEFDISHQESVPRPWFFSKLMPEASDPVFGQFLGLQLFNVGRVADAKPLLEQAFRRKPDSAEAALALARVHMALGEPTNVPLVLSLFLAPPQSPNYDIYVLAGRAHEKLGEYAKATEILEKAISHFGVNADLLNMVGEDYARLGRTKEALAAWDKSLQLNANQPDIKKKADALREKK